jgi:Tfp pilus assembly protein PilO
MKKRNWWIWAAAGGAAVAIGIGTMIWFSYQENEQKRSEVVSLRANIEAARKTIEGTRTTEREVIVLRELSEVMKEILPDDNDINNLVRTLQKFSEESQVRISGLKKKNTDSRDKTDFDKVAYTLSLEGDAFQLLQFLDMVESHSRFMRVPSFRITAAQRAQMEKEGLPAHKVTVDVETYVYEPKKDAPAVKIDGYELKRDLLMGEISRRRQALAVSSYSYRGARGRRDPWIDPRVPVLGDGSSPLTVQEQMDIVQKLQERTQDVVARWERLKLPTENTIEGMLLRAELDEVLAALDEEVRRVEAAKTIRYVPSTRRLQIEVVDVIAGIHKEILESGIGAGPSENMLRQIEETMVHHMEKGEYTLITEAYLAVDNQLRVAEADPLRKPLVARIQDLVHEARTVLDFQKIELSIDGLALVDDRSLVLLNGKAVEEGDMLDGDILVRRIRPEEIEFVFRGVVFAKQVELGSKAVSSKSLVGSKAPASSKSQVGRKK